MCTIIKVKRKITEDPVECLILECKKKKLNIEEDTESEGSGDKTKNLIKQILKYAGSALNEEEIPFKIREISNKPEEPIPKRRTKISLSISKTKTKVSTKTEKVVETKSLNYVMTSKKRGLDDNEDTSQDKKIKASTLDNINIIDVISSDYFKDDQDSVVSPKAKRSSYNRSPSKPDVTETITCNGVELIREKVNKKPNTNEYVYDIYYTKNSDIHLDLLYPNNYEIKSFNDYQNVELVDDAQGDEQEEFYEDDEDSNDECNWRNDYPDEEDDIDDEDDEEPHHNKNSNRYDYDEDDYGDGYDEGDDLVDKKLSGYMKKSLALDRSYHEDDSENEDYDEYEREEIEKSYTSYKKRILKELEQDYNVDV